MSQKTAYVAFSTDLYHTGHVNIINHAAKYGSVVVGILTDEAIATYKRPPILSTEERKQIVENFKNVDRVVLQTTLNYTQNLRELKPDYVVHGDDWRTGIQQKVRARVIEVLAEWGGELIEVPYTSGTLSSDKLSHAFNATLNTPEIRLGKLKKLLQLKPYVRAIDTSNGLTGLIAEHTHVTDPDTSAVKEFDAMWISSLCDSSFKGKPDIELVEMTSRIQTINEIMEVTTKPIILDGDTGGKIEHFSYHVKTLERMGVSAVIIEDKTGLKQNSLFGTDAVQELDEPESFALKIQAGKQAQATRDFMVIARLESLIAGKDVDDALMRAKIYVKAGADAVMIHSKEKHGKDIFEFMTKFREYSSTIPIVVVPTTYNQFTEDELHAAGANIIIHANHLLRSAYPAMVKTAESILSTGSSLQASKEFCMPIKEVLTFI
ncbi:MAG: phosphoenolpyruvate mutase [Defluviitaleaceae bacterium]|nr:phosphoenolpyruvate mutase [Defluviitaleaceae bacterium]